MTSYVLSEHEGAWRVYRLGTVVEEIATDVTEEQARSIATKRAVGEAPSQVLQVPPDGSSRVVATFEGEEDGGELWPSFEF